MKTEWQPSKELQQLVAALCVRELDEPGTARLEELTADDQDALAYVVDTLNVEAELHWLLAGQHDDLPAPRENQGLEVISTQPAGSEDVLSGFHWRSHPGRFGVAVVVLTLLFWIGVYTLTDFRKSNNPNRNPAHQGQRMVAQLTGTYEAEWGEGVVATQVDALLQHGYRVELEKGLVEITYLTGAKVVLEGPCDFVVDAANAGTLKHGKLTANVSERAFGFAVHASHIDIVDLGTEFGVAVDQEGACEVHVYEGQVEVSSDKEKQQSPKHLLVGESLQFDRNGKQQGLVQSPRETPPAKFNRRLPSVEGLPEDVTYEQLVAALKPVAWYRMETNGESVLQDSSELANHGRTHRSGVGLGLPFSDGKVGDSLRLRGASFGDYALVADYPKAKHGQLTVMAWVYAESLPEWGIVAANWGTSKTSQLHFGLNQNGRHISIHVTGSDGQQVTATSPQPFSTGNWQHVAFVSTGSELQLYCNGRKVAVAPCSGLVYPAPLQSLSIGCKANDDGRTAAGMFWHGKIDEMIVCNSALSPRAIWRVYKYPTETAVAVAKEVSDAPKSE